MKGESGVISRDVSSSARSDDIRGLVIASIAGLVINFLSSLFTGATALILMVAGIVVLAVLLRARSTQGNALPHWASFAGSTKLLAFLSVAALVGAIVGGISVLPLLPGASFSVPWTALFSPEDLEYMPSFHGYEALATGVISILACIAFFRGQHLVRVLGFVVAAIGGAVVAFSAFGPDFSAPVQTFAGWSIAAVATIWLVSVLPSAFQILAEFFQIGARRQR